MKVVFKNRVDIQVFVFTPPGCKVSSRLHVFKIQYHTLGFFGSGVGVSLRFPEGDVDLFVTNISVWI